MMEALSPANIGLLLFGIFFVLLLIGSPIMVALGVATMACFIVLDIDLSLMIERAFASLTAFPLMALPAFVLAGSLMEAAGDSDILLKLGPQGTESLRYGGTVIPVDRAGQIFKFFAGEALRIGGGLPACPGRAGGAAP